MESLGKSLSMNGITIAKLLQLKDIRYVYKPVTPHEASSLFDVS